MSGVVSVVRCCVRSSDVVVDVTASYCSTLLLSLMSSIICCGITCGVNGGAGRGEPSLGAVWWWIGAMLLCMDVAFHVWLGRVLLNICQGENLVRVVSGRVKNPLLCLCLL